MEIQEQTNKIFLENVVYTKEKLTLHLQRDSLNLLLGTTKWYKQTPSGPELFSLPEYVSYRGCKAIQLLPDKFTCDIWGNENFEIESVLLKSVWENKKSFPFEEWLEDIEKKLRKLKQKHHEYLLANQKSTELLFQAVEIEDELKKFIPHDFC